MSEVTEAHGLTGDVSRNAAQVAGDAGAEDYSGYLCGACEEPLPLGAAACLVCGTPVAPLEDEEMTAGPYVFADPVTGELPAIVVDDPYGNESEIAGHVAGGAGVGADLTPAGMDRSPAAPHETGPGTSATGNGAARPDDGWSPPLDDLAAPAPTDRNDPAQVIGVERPEFPRPHSAETGPDPMLGRAPTEPVLSPPPPRIVTPTQNPPRPEPVVGLKGARDDSPPAAPASSGPVMPLVLGAVVAVLALVGVGAAVMSRSGPDPTVAAPPTTAASRPAPAPTTASDESPSTTAAAVVPNTDTFCLAALQFRIDPDPDSVAAKFLANPTQMVATVEALVNNAPADVKPQLVPLEETVNVLATKIRARELRTPAQVRAAADSASQAPGWPRYEKVIAPAVIQHCQQYLAPPTR